MLPVVSLRRDGFDLDLDAWARKPVNDQERRRRNFHAVRGIAGMSQDSIIERMGSRHRDSLAWVVAHMDGGQQMVLPCCP